IPMKILMTILLLLGMSTRVSGLGGGTSLDGVQPGIAEGILQSIENANVTHAGADLLVTRKYARTPVEMVFTRCQGLGVKYAENQLWVLPLSATGEQIDANRALWILPLYATSQNHSW